MVLKFHPVKMNKSGSSYYEPLLLQESELTLVGNSDSDHDSDHAPQPSKHNTEVDTKDGEIDHDYHQNKPKPSNSIVLVTDDDEALIKDSVYELTTPYRQKNCCSRMHYYFETFLVTHRRIHAVYLLLQKILPRALVLFDMYTDFLVAKDLYDSGDTFWFMISSLFLFTPMLLVWVASLRFLQNWVSNAQLESKSKFQRFFINFGIFIYIFPPIGSALLFIWELIWMFGDIGNGFKAFILGRGFIEKHDAKYLALKVN